MQVPQSGFELTILVPSSDSFRVETTGLYCLTISQVFYPLNY